MSFLIKIGQNYAMNTLYCKQLDEKSTLGSQTSTHKLRSDSSSGESRVDYVIGMNIAGVTTFFPLQRVGKNALA